MSQGTFRMRRRVGGALLAGVTALGVAALAGEGVASAAATTATATVTGTVASVPSFQLPAAGLPITITPSPAAVAGDTVALTLSCASGLAWNTGATGTKIQSAGATAAVAVGTADSNGWTANVSSGSCGTSVLNVLTISGAAATGVASFAVTPSYALATGATIAASGSVAPTGTYNSAGGQTTFAVPADLTITNGSVTTTSPVPALSTGSLNQALNPVTVTLPAAPAASGNLCVELTPSSATVSNAFDIFSGKPTVTLATGQDATNFTLGTPAVANAPGTLTTPATGSAVQGNVLVVPFTLTGTPSVAPSFTINGLKADANVAGPASASVGSCTTPAAGTTTFTAQSPASTVFTVGSTNAAIYGQTADATAAAEFEAANVNLSGATAQCNPNYNAVLATDVTFNDALSASYLESYLNTGVLTTPQGSLGADALNALKLAGVQRVYVVGGPLAVSQSVITALQSTPSYNCGGLTQRGFNIQVYGPIYGQTADDTAQQINSYVPSSYIGTPSFNAAYSAASGSNGGGLYNQTAGNSSATGPTAAGATAIVASDTDFQDVMSAAGLAYSAKLPVILTPGTALGTQATAQLTSLGIKQVIALGGNLALSNSVVTSIQAMGIPVLRIAGYDYTQTAAELAQFESAQLGWANNTVLVAQGSYWSDALAAGEYAAGMRTSNVGAFAAGAPSSLLLTEGPTKGVGTYTDNALKMAGTAPSGLGTAVTTGIQVLGGPLAVTANQITEMQNALASGA